MYLHFVIYTVVPSVADWNPDPGSSAFLTPESRPGSGWMENNSGSGINISESVVTIFWVKMRKFFVSDPGSGMGKSGFGIKFPDPQHCSYRSLKLRGQFLIRLDMHFIAQPERFKILYISYG